MKFTESKLEQTFTELLMQEGIIYSEVQEGSFKMQDKELL